MAPSGQALLRGLRRKTKNLNHFPEHAEPFDLGYLASMIVPILYGTDREKNRLRAELRQMIKLGQLELDADPLIVTTNKVFTS